MSDDIKVTLSATQWIGAIEAVQQVLDDALDEFRKQILEQAGFPAEVIEALMEEEEE